VGKAFARLLDGKRPIYPFPIVRIHTANHGSAFHIKGLSAEPRFGPKAASVEEFLERAQPSVLIDLTTLNPQSGEPAIAHASANYPTKPIGRRWISASNAELHLQGGGGRHGADSALEDGGKEAQAMGVADADASFDIDGWDSANVLMDAKVKPQHVERAASAVFQRSKLSNWRAPEKPSCLSAGSV